MSATALPPHPADIAPAERPAKLRIVNAMLGRGRGGLEQVLLDYGDALALAGHEVHAVIDPAAAIRPDLEARGALWHPLSNFGVWDLLAVARLRRLLRSLRPDVCIAHGNRAVTLLGRAGAWPLIGVLPNYKMHCRGLTAACHSTQDLRRYALGQGLAADKLFHIPNMVRVPPALAPRQPHTPPVIGTMGRTVAKKGFDLFIAALARLAARGMPFRAVIGGDGEDAAALRNQAAASGLAEQIAFPGWITDKPAFFAGIDLFCLPSHHEPFGIVLLEAMAHGVPVVATASEGPAEIARDGVDALMVPLGDAEALANALQALLEDPDRAAALAANGYRMVRESYDLPRVAARLDAAVRSVAGRERLAHGSANPQLVAP